MRFSVLLARQQFCARFCFARHHSQQWILPELLVVVEVLVSERQRVDPLPDHLLYAVLNQFLVPAIDETLTEPREQVHLRVGCLQQQASPVGTDRAAVELRYDLARPLDAGKLEPILVTLCHSKGRSLSHRNMS